MTPSIATLVRAEGSKLARQPATLALAVILVTYLGVMALAFSAILRAPEMEGFDREAFVAPMRARPIAFALSLFSGTATILIVVFASMLVGQEHSKATLRTLLLAGATRRSFVLAKLTTLLLAAALVASIGTTFAYGSVWLFERALGEELSRAGLAEAGWSLLGLFALLSGWATLAATATLWRGSLAIGIGTTVALLVVGDVVAGLLATAGDLGILASRLFPNAAFSALAGARAPPAGAWLWIVPSLAFYLGLLPWLATRRFERADVVALTRR